MSREEIKAAIAEQRAMVDAALGGMRIPPSLERTWRRLARQQEEQPDE